MLIPIKRIYLSTGLEVEMLINTDYIIKIEPSENDPLELGVVKPRTRIAMDGIGEVNIIYTNEFISTIKGKLTIARKINKK